MAPKKITPKEQIDKLEKKVQSFAQVVTVFKTDEIVRDIYKNKVLKMAEMLARENKELFGKFYRQQIFSIHIDRKSYPIEEAEKLAKQASNLYSFTKQIELSYLHHTFKYNKVPAFQHYQKITFNLHETHYTIETHFEHKVLEKYYTDVLTEEEMQAIISAEVKNHLEKLDYTIGTAERDYRYEKNKKIRALQRKK